MFPCDCILDRIIYKSDGVPGVVLKCRLYYFNYTIGDYIDIYTFNINLSDTKIFYVPLLNSENNSINSLPLFPSSLWRLEYRIITEISNQNESTIIQINNILQRSLSFVFHQLNVDQRTLNVSFSIKNFTINLSDICNTDEIKIINKYELKDMVFNLYKYNNILSLSLNSKLLLHNCYRNLELYYPLIKPTKFSFLYQQANSNTCYKNMLITIQDIGINIIDDSIYYAVHPILGIIQTLKEINNHYTPPILIQNYTSNTIYYKEINSNIIKKILPFKSESVAFIQNKIFLPYSPLFFSFIPQNLSNDSDNCWSKSINIYDNYNSIFIPPPNSYDELKTICVPAYKLCYLNIIGCIKNGSHILSIYPSCYITNKFNFDINIKLYCNRIYVKEMNIKKNNILPLIIPSLEEDNNYLISIQPLIEDQSYEYSKKYELIFKDKYNVLIKIYNSILNKDFILLIETTISKLENNTIFNILIEPIIKIDNSHFEWELKYNDYLFTHTQSDNHDIGFNINFCNTPLNDFYLCLKANECSWLHIINNQTKLLLHNNSDNKFPINLEIYPSLSIISDCVTPLLFEYNRVKDDFTDKILLNYGDCKSTLWTLHNSFYLKVGYKINNQIYWSQPQKFIAVEKSIKSIFKIKLSLYYIIILL